MTTKKPEMTPPSERTAQAGDATQSSRPVEASPLSAGSCGCGTATASMTLPDAFNSDSSSPRLRPPEEGIGEGVMAWQNNKKITGLWGKNQNKNSWVHIAGVGWKRLANNSDSAIVALTMLGAHARENDSVVNYREEADGMIHEMYVW